MSAGQSDGPSIELAEAFQQRPGRYIVGIDLGTTNCAMAYVDTESKDRSVQDFRVEQVVDWTALERRDTLPSFHYQLTAQEAASVQNRWIEEDPVAKKKFIVGNLARDRGLQMPGRQIASAKSWLCHAGIDRSAAILPWHGDDDVRLWSPVEALACYLNHLREAWDRDHPQHRLAEQEVVITLPASFDEVARELTILAAKSAGLSRIQLLEEPQAAFYAWLAGHGDQWDKTIQVGQTLLVCDIGGGTTDFTLIRVKQHTTESRSIDLPTQDIRAGQASLHRVAVGQHLILGGDNMDLALAQSVEDHFKANGQERLSSRAWDALRLQCRLAKETLLGTDAPSAGPTEDSFGKSYTLQIPGSGSSLIAQARSVSLDQAWIQRVLLDGFFPEVALRDRPLAQQSGFQEFGLPYASDPAITRHLAAFLWDQRWAGRNDHPATPHESLQAQVHELVAARPDWVLFNGGVLESGRIRQSILNAIESWFQEVSQEDVSPSSATGARWHIRVLEGNRLDLAVAQGAAYYGLVRRGQGVRIHATLARAYYLQIAHEPPQALCIVPGDAGAGDRFTISEPAFELAIGEPVEFSLWVSSTRLVDTVGSLVAIDPEAMVRLPPIRTVLEMPKSKRRETIQVALDIELTELGTIQLACHAMTTQQRWRLDFDVRSTVQTDRAAHLGLAEQAGIVPQETIQRATDVVDRVFGQPCDLGPNDLIKQLGEAIQQPRLQWRPSLLRALWQRLIELDEGRKKSAQHEARWLNLLGYCLRPGFGFAADDWRVSTTWRKVQGKLAFRSASNLAETIILWRRIAGGFTQGQQLALLQELLPRVRAIVGADARGPGASGPASESIELLRLVGSLELVGSQQRGTLGNWIVAALGKKKLQSLAPAFYWTLGRLGARVPSYGPANHLVSTSQVESWLAALLARPPIHGEHALAVMQLARKTGDRYRDISEACQRAVLDWMRENGVHRGYLPLVEAYMPLDSEQQSAIQGEALPLGLKLGA